MRRRARALVAAIVCGAVLAGCSGSGGSPGGTPTLPDGEGLDPYYAQELDWADCGEGWECSKLLVPMDYADPSGATVEIVVNRLPATGDDRLGSLVVNPGGPGASGVAYARTPDVVTEQVLQAYDLVGFDPRGVAGSAPIDCIDDDELDVLLALDASPDDEAEATELDEAMASFAAGCKERSGDLLPHMGTVDVARDLDVLRAALGDDQLNYLGASYGTLIGLLFAEQFPDHVGRFVLDGVLDPASDVKELALGQAAGFDRALLSFLEDCQIYLEDCPLIGDLDDGKARIGDFLEQLDTEPITTASGRVLTQSLGVIGVVLALYDPESGWPLLRQALTEVFEEGTAETLLVLADFYFQRDTDGTYKSNSNESIYAVNCLDRGDPLDIDAAVQATPEFEAASPVFGAYVATGAVACAHWPVEPTNETHEITAPGAGPILVIGNTRDPATPYEAAKRVADSLESGVLVTFRGDGHTAYTKGHICVDEHVDAYFLTGETPRDGARC